MRIIAEHGPLRRGECDHGAMDGQTDGVQRRTLTRVVLAHFTWLLTAIPIAPQELVRPNVVLIISDAKGADESLLPFLQAASAQSRVASGPDMGRPIPRLVDPVTRSSDRDRLEPPRGALVASSDGYSLHAATCIEAGRRADLEHLLRYMARPPLCQGRLMLREDGKVIWNLRKPWRDGTRSFVFAPLVFLERLVALIPHPREHQLTYHGCLAPASPVRDHVVPLPPSRRERPANSSSGAPNQPVARRRFSWAELLLRVFSEDVLSCPRCGSRRHMIAMITDPPTIRRFLLHLKLPPDPLPIAPAREPAQADLF